MSVFDGEFDGLRLRYEGKVTKNGRLKLNQM
jgi:hypothetical protein